jgi:hypothetical protein
MSRKIAREASKSSKFVAVSYTNFPSGREDCPMYPTPFIVVNANPCDWAGHEKKYGHYVVLRSTITGSERTEMAKNIMNFDDVLASRGILYTDLMDAVDSYRKRAEDDKSRHLANQRKLDENVRLVASTLEGVGMDVEIGLDDEGLAQTLLARIPEDLLPTIIPKLSTRELGRWQHPSMCYKFAAVMCIMLGYLTADELHDLCELEEEE